MESRKILLVMAIAWLGFASCKKVIPDYQFPEFQQQPSICAILREGETVKVLASYAQSTDSIHPALCGDAELLLFVNDTFTERLYFDEETLLYVGETCIVPGKRFTCKAVFPNHDTVMATTIVPEPAEILGYEWVDVAGVNDDGYGYPALKVTFRNDTSCQRYYQMVIKTFHKQNSWIIDESYKPDDPVLLNEGLPILVFGNGIMENDTYTMKINYSISYVHNGVPQFPDKQIVELYSIPYEYYQYLKTHYLYTQTLDMYDAIFIGTMPPFNVYSNVENGYGLFTAYSFTQSDTIFRPTDERRTP